MGWRGERARQDGVRGGMVVREEGRDGHVGGESNSQDHGGATWGVAAK